MSGGRGVPRQATFSPGLTSSVDRSVQDKLAEVVSVKDYGAVGNAIADDTTAIQNAINTGNSVFFPVGNYKITNSLYVDTDGQLLYGAGLILMDPSLGKPCLWLGASDANGTPSTVPRVTIRVQSLKFQGNIGGTAVAGSAGIAFVHATTAELQSVLCWYFYAGIDVRGISLANSVTDADLRLNHYGVYDRTDGTGTINFQGSRFYGGRIEENINSGVITGSADIGFVGTIVEGNSSVSDGGTGTDPEVQINPGFQSNGQIDFIDCYMETTGVNTSTCMIQVNANASRHIQITGGSYYGADATNRYIITTNSNSTAQAFSIIGGQFNTFKNYVSGTIANNCWAFIAPCWADASRDVTTSLSASAAATVTQFDRVLGLKMVGPFNGPGYTVDGTSGFDAIKIGTTGARLHLGAGTNDYLFSDGVNVKAPGNIVAVGFAVNGGTYGNNAVASTGLKGGVADGAGAIGCKIANGTALTNATANILGLYSDNFSTLKLKFDLNGKMVPNTVASTKTAGASIAGTVALDTNGTVTVSTTAVAANSLIFLQRVLDGGTVGGLYTAKTADITAATSFIIRSFVSSTAGAATAATLDTSTIAWWIVN